jgi:hypothetical protein
MEEMFKALKFGKLRREGLEELSWADIFKPNEDFQTAAVFSRLLYMPPEALSALLLRDDADVRLGEVAEAAFWPTWRVRPMDAEARNVEPDLYIQSEGLDVIVEAKRYDDPVCQGLEQWAREWAAWHQSDDFDHQKPVLLLAIGGLGTTLDTTKANAKSTRDAANNYLLSKFPGVPVIQVAGVSWRELYIRLTEVPGDGVQAQLLRDIREILSYFGHRTYEHLIDLARRVTDSKNSGIDLRSRVVLEAWEIAPGAPDWLGVSRLFHPISTSSIEMFQRKIW